MLASLCLALASLSGFVSARNPFLTSFAFSIFEEPSSASSLDFDTDSSGYSECHRHTVDISTVPWIAQNPEFHCFQGIQIPSGKYGYLESLSIVLNAVLNTDAKEFNEKFEIEFFEKWTRLFHADSDLFGQFEKLFNGSCTKLIEAFIKFAIKRKDFALVEFLVSRSYANVVIDEETTPNLTAYFKTRAKEFFKIYFEFTVTDIDPYKILIELGLNQDQMCSVLDGLDKSTSEALRKLCTLTASSFLLRPDIRAQVLQVYNCLNTESQLKVRKALYFRSILNDELEEAALTPANRDDFMAMFLGPRRDSFALIPNLKDTVHHVIHAAEIDPSIMDWFLSRVDRADLVNLFIAFYQISTGSSVPAIQSNTSIDNQVVGKYAKLFKETLSWVEMLRNKNLVTFTLSGQTDFLTFLNNAPVEFLPIVGRVVAEYGTVDDFLAYFNRVKDEDELINLFHFFWTDHRVTDQFAQCALLLLDHVKSVPNPFHIFAESYLIKYPDVLVRINQLKVGICFKFSAIVEEVLDDETFEKMMQVQHVYKDMIPYFRDFNLKMLPKQLDRVLHLLNLSMHELLQLHWSEKGFFKIYYVDDLLEVFVALKRWQRDHSEEIVKLLTSSAAENDSLGLDPNLLAIFDDETEELIKAYLLLGKSIESRALNDQDP